jgi:hypothetical protein
MDTPFFCLSTVATRARVIVLQPLTAKTYARAPADTPMEKEVGFCQCVCSMDSIEGK